MKKLLRFLTVTAVSGSILASPSAFAGQCCINAVANAKAGKACEHSLTKQCCKDAVAKAGVADQSKTCPKCKAMQKKASS
jgi:hypothetical protein